MKIPWRHIFTAAFAAGLGCLAAAVVSPSAYGPDRLHRTALGKSSGAAGNYPAASAAELAGRFTVELAAVRAVPGASCEIAWVQWAMGIADGDIPMAISRLNPNSDFHALRYLYARWTKLDPKAAWASFYQSGIPGQSNHFYNPANSEYAESWTSPGLQGSSIQEQPRSLIASRMLVCWNEVDPEGAKALAAKLKGKSSPEAVAAGVEGYYIDSALSGKVDQTPLTADQCVEKAAEAKTLPEGASERYNAIRNTMNQWMATDSAAAGEWFKTLSVQDRASVDMGAALASMSALPPEQRANFALLCLEPGSRDLPTAFDPGQTFDPTRFSSDWENSPSRKAGDAFLREWAARDPAAASAWLNNLPENDQKSTLTARTAAAMVAKDEAGAIALLNNMEGDQQQALVTFMSSWAASDAEASLQWAAKIQDGQTRDNCLATASSSLAATYPEQALEAAVGITNPELRARIFSRVEQNLSWNPAAQAQLRAQYPDGPWREKANP